MDTKKCTRCGRVLPTSEFSAKKAAKDGLQCYCRECANEIAHKRNMSATKALKALATAVPSEERIEADGRTLVKVKPSIESFSNRELLAEIKKRGSVWDNMWHRQKVEYSKI